MKNRLSLGVLSVLSLGLALACAGEAAAAVATVQGAQGDVLVRKAGAGEDAWTPVTGDTPLDSGDAVKTRAGSCTISYAEQGSFSMGPESTVTLEDKAASQDLRLDLGTLKGKINKERTLKPFQIVTPVAVAAVRGTEVDFSLDGTGQLVIDLHNGNIQVFDPDQNGQMDLPLGGSKTVTLKFDKEKGLLTIKNECGSDGPIAFTAAGVNYSSAPCEEIVVDLSTAGGGDELPTPPGTENLSETTLNEGAEEDIPPPVSEVNP